MNKALYFFRRLFLAAKIFFLSAGLLAQAPQCQWLQSSSGFAYNGGNVQGMAADNFGNVIEIGSYSDTSLVFGPYSLHVDVLVPLSFFIVKYNAQGQPLWLCGLNKIAGQSAFGQGEAVIADRAGNIYAVVQAGSDSGGAVIFGTDTFVAPGIWDSAFLVKYNFNGDLLWAKVLDTVPAGSIYGLALDPQDNIIETGNYRMSKYSPDGVLLWSSAEPEDGAVACAPGGNIYSAGLTFGSIVFNGDTLSGDFFIIKRNSSGNVLWAKSMLQVLNTWSFSLSIDSGEDIYINLGTLSYGGDSTAIFGNDTIAVNPAVSSPDFVFKLDSSGTPLWGRLPFQNCVGGGSTVAIAATADGGMVFSFAANCQGSFVFAQDTITGFGGILLAKYDWSGNPQWVVPMKNTDWPTTGGICVNKNGNIFTGGTYVNLITCDSLSVTATGGNNAFFLAELGDSAPPQACMPSFTTLNDTICSSDTAYMGGMAYTSPGIYYDTLLNQNGCDSFITLALTINPPSFSTLNDTICSGDTLYWHSKAYTMQGNYADTLQNVNGCDSIVSLNLSVDSIPPVTIAGASTPICPYDTALLCAAAGYTSYFWGDTSRCIYVHTAGTYSVKVTDTHNCTATGSVVLDVYPVEVVAISVSCDTLTAYCSHCRGFQWFRNDQSIPGATHSVYVADSIGNYIVTITDSNGCNFSSSPIFESQFDSSCLTGIRRMSGYNGINVYPNPAGDCAYISFDASLTGADAHLYDISGRELMNIKLIASPQLLPISNLSSGTYVVVIDSNGQRMAQLLNKLF